MEHGVRVLYENIHTLSRLPMRVTLLLFKGFNYYFNKDTTLLTLRKPICVWMKSECDGKRKQHSEKGYPQFV